MRDGSRGPRKGRAGWRLAGIAAGLLAIVLSEVVWLARQPDSLPPPPAARAAPDSRRPPAASPRPLAERTASILARPLFAPDRRPAGAPPPEAASDPPPRLAGIVIGPASRSAIFVADDAEHPIVAREGDQVGRFVIDLILPGAVAARGPGGLVSWTVGFARPAVTSESTPAVSEQALHARGGEAQHAE